MTDPTTVQTWIGDGLRDAGLRGRGSIWRAKGLDVQWVVHIDRLPYGDRLGVDIGLDLQTRTTPRRPTDCAVLLHLENLPATRDLAISTALDPGSDVDEGQRRQEIEAAATAIGHYLAAHQTLHDVRAAYKSGDFASGFIRKDARTVLESAGSP